MITFQQFIDKYTFKFIDFDGYWGFQCTDLVRAYISQVLGLPAYTLPGVKYAKELYTKFQPNQRFQRIPNVWNDMNSYPRPGDIIVWDFYPFVTGWAGHTAVCTWADGKSIIAFSQNFPTSTGCFSRSFDYRGVLGWLRAM